MSRGDAEVEEFISDSIKTWGFGRCLKDTDDLVWSDGGHESRPGILMLKIIVKHGVGKLKSYIFGI